jgi:SAM-dependent methyltransferase
MTEAEPREMNAGQAFWADRWRTGRTGWDQGGPHPLLPGLIEEAEQLGFLKPGDRILEPGAGRAHNGAYLARRGYQVTSFDAAEEAIEEARKLYGNEPNLKLEVADALTARDPWRGEFQVVFDRAMLCALPKKLRRAYVQASFTHLAPSGVFLTIPFTECRISEAEGPPFQVTMTDLSEFMLAGFSLVHAEDHDLPEGDRIVKETACIWRRRKRPLIESE